MKFTTPGAVVRRARVADAQRRGDPRAARPAVPHGACCAPATWGSPRPRPTTSRSGCRARRRIARSRPAATPRRSRRAARTSSSAPSGTGKAEHVAHAERLRPRRRPHADCDSRELPAGGRIGGRARGAPAVHAGRGGDQVVGRRMRLLRLAVLGAMLAAIGSVGHGQQVPPPRFTAGVDLVQIDVSVLDRHGAPVTGLSADDFVVLENGKPQQIRGFASIAVPPPIAPPAAWLRDTGPDVVSNAAETRRLVVILMDDALTGFEEGEATRARAVAHAAVERLGPADLAAVVFTHLGRAQNFTADRRELNAAIESFSPRGGTSPGRPLACLLQRGGCVVASLQSIGNVLAAAPPGRKLLIYVGSAPDISFKGDEDDPVSVVTDMFRSLQRANVEVNAFDVAGLRTFAGTASDRTVKDMNARVVTARAAQDGLRTLADNTGGRAVVNTNAPEAAIADVFRRNSAYYLVGFQSSDTRTDGRYRRIEVKVNRLDVEVRTRSGYYAARPADSRKKPDAAPLEAALAQGLPLPDLALQLHASVVPVPGRREAWVIVTSGLLQSPDFAAEHVTVLTAAFDTGATERGRHRQSFDLPARDAASGTLPGTTSTPASSCDQADTRSASPPKAAVVVARS